MENVKQQLEGIDRLLAQIPVSGDGVYLMAAARKQLKAVYDALAVDHEYTVKEENTNGG